MTDEPNKRTFLSLGAGVQSSTLYLMACHGEFGNPPEAAIFADTGWEPMGVYDWLDYLKDGIHQMAKDCGRTDIRHIPIHVIKYGNLREDSISNVLTPPGDAKPFASIPLHGYSLEDRPMMMRRQCTREYKVTPITKKIRKLLEYKPHQRVKTNIDLWIGISKDEVQRAKPNREKWITNQWPLLDRNMTREDCKTWMIDHKYPVPPKSACLGCPYHDDNTWRDMKMNNPKDFKDTVEFERIIHNGLKDSKGIVYIHNSLKLLDEVDFENAEDKGQLNMFNNECEGYCGI